MAHDVGMRISRWFLPETPDVLGMLHTQAGLTIDAMDALSRWAAGEHGADDDVRRLEHEADDAKRELRKALRVAFTVPVDAEDLYALSERLDALVNAAKDAVREAEVMGIVPDVAMAEMADELGVGIRRLVMAIDGLVDRDDSLTEGATADADAGVKQSRRLERSYRKAMSALLDLEDLREVAARREMYRRFSALGDLLAQIGDRVWYAAVKES
jgi:uncharacterized protein Yka (UPF0111/DUF47 family)